jgi:hypothetical protein
MDKPKKLKTRSEALREKREREASSAKTSAAERTIPIKGSGLPGYAQCEACHETVKSADCTLRPSGELECSACGAPIPKEGFTGETHDAVKERLEPKPDATKGEARDLGFVRPVYCNKCGAKWEIINGRPWPNCGHVDGFVDDPTKAEKWNPPAGHPRPPPDAIVGKAGEPRGDVRATTGDVPASAARVRTTPLEGGLVRLDVEWGKVTFSRGHYNTVGPFAVHVDCEPEKVLEVGIHMLGQLEKLADHAMRQQHEWFVRKLSEIEAENERGR